MHVNYLPDELLVLVLRHVPRADLRACNATCTRWAAVLHAHAQLSETLYHTLCETEYPDIYESAHNASTLSWRALHAALAAWRYVGATTATQLRTLWQRDTVVRIDRGVIACPYRKQGIDKWDENVIKSSEDARCDAVVFYDATTLSECRREIFNVSFTRFLETEHLIVLPRKLSFRSSVTVILKADRNFSHNIQNVTVWWMSENKVYCHTGSNEIWKVGTVEINNRKCLEIETELVSEKTVFALERYTSKHIDEWISDGYRVFGLIDNKLTWFHSGEQAKKETAAAEAKIFPKGIKRLFLTPWDDEKIINPFLKTVFQYGKTVFVIEACETFLRVEIYWDPFGVDGKLCFADLRPLKTFELAKVAPEGRCVNWHKSPKSTSWYSGHVRDLTVVETAQGPRLLLLYGPLLLVAGLEAPQTSSTDDF